MKYTDNLTRPGLILISGFILLLLTSFLAAPQSRADDNLITNWHFDDWDGDQPIGWDGSHSFATNWFQDTDALVGKYSVRVDGGGQRDLDQFGKTMSQTETYYAEVWVKGTGDINLGIKYPGSTYIYYGGAQSIDTTEWVKVTVSRSPTDDGDEGGIRIRTDDSGAGTILIGAVWLSDTPSPICWALSPAPGFPEGFDNFGTGTRPAGWTFETFTDSHVYTAEGDYGVASPSIKFDDEATVVTTREFSDALELNFWFKGMGTDNTSSFLVEESYDSSYWSTVTDIVPLPTTGTIIGPLPLKVTSIRLRFTYNQSVGNLAFDDVSVCTTDVPVPLGRRIFTIW